MKKDKIIPDYEEMKEISYSITSILETCKNLTQNS